MLEVGEILKNLSENRYLKTDKKIISIEEYEKCEEIKKIKDSVDNKE